MKMHKQDESNHTIELKLVLEENVDNNILRSIYHTSLISLLLFYCLIILVGHTVSTLSHTQVNRQLYKELFFLPTKKK
jgi:hypothetical protein